MEKIYRALSTTYTEGLPYLGVINNPNRIGLDSNYQHQAINLAPNASSQGLPPFIASFFNKQIDIIKNGRSATNLNLCEGDSYTLTSTEILGASYRWTLDDNLLPGTSFELEVTQSGHYEVYIDPNNGDCAIEGDAFVLYNPNPIAKDHTFLQCDEDGISDGFTLFNLNEAKVDLNDTNSTTLTKFYLDPARTQEIDGSSFANTSNPQIIYIKVINDKTGCVDYSELTLEVSTTDSNDTTYAVCDDDSIEDGFYNFNLKNIDNLVVSGLPTTGLNITYFETYENALLEQSDLGDTFTNTIPHSQTIYARVENNNNCYGISEVLLVVNPLPDIETKASEYYCLNTFPVTIEINAGLLNGNIEDHIFSWSSGEDTYSININEVKDYTVTVTNNKTFCSKTRTVTVLASNIASIDDIIIKDASQNNTITVMASGEGEYLYQLLDENNLVYVPYQENNVFENVFPGFYYVSVKDIKNNCGTAPLEKIAVIGFPKFFTPNNDSEK